MTLVQVISLICYVTFSITLCMIATHYALTQMLEYTEENRAPDKVQCEASIKFLNAKSFIQEIKVIDMW